jgi:hypothetical protein
MLLPKRFQDAYVSAFGAEPPWAIRRAYEILVEYVYWGHAGGDAVASVGPRKSYRTGIGLKGADLLALKTQVDSLLDQTASVLERWQRGSEGEGGSVPPRPRKCDLVGAGSERIRTRG